MTKSKGSLRIAHVIPCDAIGGVEIAARSMEARKDLPCLFQIIWLVENSQSRSSLNPIAQISAIRKIIRFDPHIVICSLWRTVFVGIACKLLRPQLQLVQFLHSERATHWADAAMTQLGMKIADMIWADSTRSLVRALPNSSHRTISFVTDRLINTKTLPQKILRFVSWGRLVYQKGIDQSIELISIFVSKGINVYFEIWGPDGGEQASLEKLVSSLELTDHVGFMGALDRAFFPTLAAQGGFFLQLSRIEGMGMAVVEAMQLGLVPVVTPVGEIARYIQDGKNGLLVNPTQLEHAADAVLSLLQDPEAHEAMRGRAVAHWCNHPLYADDVCSAAQALADKSMIAV